MTYRSTLACGLAALALAQTVHADATPPAACPPPPPPPAHTPWSGNVAVGYVHTSGNTRTGSLNAKLDLRYQSTRWGNDLSGSAFNGSRDNQTTDERYSILDKLSYNVTQYDYGFASAGYDNDRFAGIAERYTVAIGYGRHLLATKRQVLDLEIGGGGNRSREQGMRDFDNHAIGTFGGQYVLKLTPTSQFSETLRSEYSSDNIYVNPVTELKLNVIGALFAAIDFEIRYNKQTPAGTRHVDQITTVNLGYSFGVP